MTEEITIRRPALTPGRFKALRTIAAAGDRGHFVYGPELLVAPWLKGQGYIEQDENDLRIYRITLSGLEAKAFEEARLERSRLAEREGT